MLAPRRRIFTGLLVLADLVVVIGAFYAAYRIRFPSGGLVNYGAVHRADNLLILATGLLAWPPILRLAGFYEPERLLRPGRVLARLLVLAALVGLIIAAVLFLAQAKMASRMVLLLYVTLSVPALGGVRWIVARALRWWATHNNPLVLIVGGGAEAAELGQRLLAEPELGSRPAGYVVATDEPLVVDQADVLGQLDDLEALLDEHVVDLVAIALPSASAAQVEAISVSCREVGLDVVVVASEMDALIKRAAIDSVGGVPVLRLRGSPQFRATMAAKRVFDVVVAGLLLVLALPLLVLIALAVKLTSRGPTLFVQERVGLNGRSFRLYKFRSMVRGAEEQRGDLEAHNEMDGPTFKMTADPRVTPVGRFLRRFSLDELPQLVNVLRGDMSLVGPRPPLVSEVAQYDRWQRRRLSVKPGLTCTWQVSGRSEVDFETWMQLDLGYIDNWSPWLDLKIIARTIPAVLSGRGAR